MELIAFTAFMVIEGFVLWCGFVLGYNRAAKVFADAEWKQYQRRRRMEHV